MACGLRQVGGPRGHWQVPVEALPPPVAAVTMAVIAGARTFREIADMCGWVSPGDAHLHARKARQMGLIDFEDHTSATLHPLLEIIAVSPRG